VAFYISSYQDILYFFFGIIALNLISNTNYKYRLQSASILVLLSLFSKESGILFVFATSLYVFLFDRKEFTKYFIFQAIILGIYFIFRYSAIGFSGAATSFPVAELTLFQRLLNFPDILFFYIKTFLFPLNLSSSYNWVNEQISITNFFIPLLFNLLAVAVFIFMGLKYRNTSSKHLINYYVFFGLIIIASICLHSQIIPLDATVAERWFYFSMFGLLGITGIILSWINVNKKWLWIFLIIILKFVMGLKKKEGGLGRLCGQEGL